MDSGGFSGIAVFLVLAVITGVIGWLAVQQSKIKRQIEEDRRERERNELAGMTAATPSAPPEVGHGSIPDITPQSLPKITPGGTPPPDARSHHHGGGH